MSYFYVENKFLEFKIDSFFKKLSILNSTHFNGELSILLLGSMSRGEATWKKTNNGYELLSDIEFFTVFPDDFTEFKMFEDQIQKIGKELFNFQKSPLFHIDNTFININKLGKLEKKLITYDAIYYGKTVVGKDVISKLPEVDLHTINFIDIHDILIHRAFSVLYYGNKLKENQSFDEYKYSLAKNSLDLMVVYLIEKGYLISGFVNRFDMLKNLEVEEEFLDYLKYCLDIKLCIDSIEVYTIDEMEKIFVKYLIKLDKDFKYPFHNFLVNKKMIIRRKFGVFKRMVKYKFVPRKTKKMYLYHLISLLENKKAMSKEDILINTIYNGYPL